MARVCESCEKRVGIPDERCESWRDDDGIEHDYCRTCWEQPLPCPFCDQPVRRTDRRTQRLSLDDEVVLLHPTCLREAAVRFLLAKRLLHAGVTA